MRRTTGFAFAALCAVVLAGCNTTGSSTAESDAGTDRPAVATEADGGATESAPEATATGMDSQALEAVTDAAANTTAAGTSRFEIVVETAGTGVADGTQPITVQGEEDFDARQRNLMFLGPEGELAVVVDDTDVYVEVPATEDEAWARIELEALITDGVGFGGPAGLPFQSPQDNIAVLGEAVTAAAESGTEEVRGETATRYDLVVDLEQAAQQGVDDSNDTFAAIVDQSGATQLDMQVWVGQEERISRVRYSLDLSQVDVEEVASEIASEDVDAQASGEATVTVEYFDYGAEVDIQIPEGENVVELDEDEIRDTFSP